MLRWPAGASWELAHQPAGSRRYLQWNSFAQRVKAVRLVAPATSRKDRRQPAGASWELAYQPAGSRRYDLPDVGEADVLDGVRVPVTVIEVPPFKLVDRESFGLHRTPEQFAILFLLRGPAG